VEPSPAPVLESAWGVAASLPPKALHAAMAPAVRKDAVTTKKALRTDKPYRRPDRDFQPQKRMLRTIGAQHEGLEMRRNVR
jgi:hypothetical protein